MVYHSSMACPYCDGLEVMRCRKAGLLDHILSWTGKQPYACAQCKAKFYQRPSQALVLAAGSRAADSLRRPEPWRSVQVVDCWRRDGAWVAEAAPEPPAEPVSFAAPDYICPKETAEKLVSLLQEEPPQETRRPKRSRRKPSKARACPS